MSIQEKIKLQRFKNNYHKLAVNLLYTASNLQSFLKQLFEREDITNQQYNILRILRGSYPVPLSTQQIRARMMEKMSDTSRIVDRLVLKELVTKRKNAADSRLVDILISEKGLQKLIILDNIEEQLIGFFGALTPEEAEEISRKLDKAHIK